MVELLVQSENLKLKVWAILGCILTSYYTILLLQMFEGDLCISVFPKVMGAIWVQCQMSSQSVRSVLDPYKLDLHEYKDDTYIF